MSDPYDEVLAGDFTLRLPPGERHELICTRLHTLVAASLARSSAAQQLAPRTEVRVAGNSSLRPDLALLTAATGKLWLAAEIVSADDHRADTVVKKQLYEDIKLARLWMLDPRYDNVEVYHSTAYGLRLEGILAGRDLLTEKLLPEFGVAVQELFAGTYGVR